MRIRVCLLIALSAAATLRGQTRPAQTSSSAPEVLKEEVFVRRVSAGATLSVMVLDWVPAKQENIISSSPVIDSLYSSSPASRRVGFGLTVQVALTERFAVNLGLLRRSVGYKKNSDIYQGVDNPVTAADERTHIVRNEDTRARLFDFPLLIRYYTKDRHVSGPRGFIQMGPVFRRVSRIRTAVDTTIGTGDRQCCDTTPARPDRSTVSGVTAGGGFQLIDQVGIRVVPEVRYTRWMGDTFKSPAVQPMRNQLEGLVSLTF